MYSNFYTSKRVRTVGDATNIFFVLGTLVMGDDGARTESARTIFNIRLISIAYNQ